jgi:6-phosphogluconolactonase (cycloisomerase 2 family)
MTVMVSAPALAQSCNAPTQDVVTTINLPSSPFAAIAAKDGCTIFVSMNGRQDPSAPGHIAVLVRADGKITVARDVAVPNQGGAVLGLALSHDGKLLAAANNSGVLLLDVNRLMAGNGKPMVETKDEAAGSAGSLGVAITADDRLLFVSDAAIASITVYDLAKLRGGDTHAIGSIPVGEHTVNMVFSPDGGKLYAISEEALDGPASCPPQGNNVGGADRQGQLTVVDVARAASDPAGAVLAKIPAGCDSVRVGLSKDGARAYVTDRAVDSLIVFDTARLVNDSGHALIARMSPGKAPVGVTAAGGIVVVADSNRLAPAGRTREWLSVIDPVTFKMRGNIPAGLFPRDLDVTADGKALLVTNTNSNSFALVDLARLTPAYLTRVKRAKDADDAQAAKFQAMLAKRVKNHQVAPGAEAVLHHLIEAFASGKPDYGAMAPEAANITNLGSPRYTAQFQSFGAIQTIAYKSTNPNGVDTLEVTFEHARTEWRIALSPDGKAAVLGFDIVK